MTWQTPKTTWIADENYNPADLNRVELNTLYLTGYLLALNYVVTLESTKTDRNFTRLEFADELSRVERNIDAVAAGFIEPPGYDGPKAWVAGTPFDYIEANRLERNLQLLYMWATGVVASFKRCGTFTCGEEGEIY